MQLLQCNMLRDSFLYNKHKGRQILFIPGNQNDGLYTFPYQFHNICIGLL